MRGAGYWLLAASLCIASPVPAQARPFTADRLADLERVSQPRISPDGKSIVFTRWHIDSASARWVAALWLMDANGARARALGPGRQGEWSPDGKRLVHVDGIEGREQLFVRPAEGSGAAVQLTSGVATPLVVRWSPDGRFLAAAMRLPVDSLSLTSERATHLFVVSTDGGDLRDVTPDYVVGSRQRDGREAIGFDWFPDGRALIVAGRSPGDAGDRSSLQVVDVATAARRPLLVQGGYGAAPLVAPDGKTMAFAGLGAAGMASVLYTVRLDGTMLRRVSQDLDREIQSLTWSDKETLWFTLDDHGARNSWMLQVGAKAPLAKPASNGAHLITLGDVSSRGGFGVVVRTSPERPEEVARFLLKQPTQFTQISHVNDDLLTSLRTGEVEELLWKSADDVPLQGWLAKPAEFDLAQKWPLLVRLPGAPRTMTTVGFSPDNQALAAHGMVVLTLNPRGAAGYGASFQDVPDDSLLAMARRDVLSAIDKVLASGYIDSTRLYLEGGTLAASLLGHGTRFRSAVLRASDDAPPLDGAPSSWPARWPVANAADIVTPTLFLLDGPAESMSRAQLAVLFGALQARGVPSAIRRLPDDGNGTVSWRGVMEEMGRWFRR